MQNSILDDIKKYGLENKVPIIKDDGLALLEQVIIENDVKEILEIGTAIAYSASKMHFANNCKVTTIERDPQMYEIACNNISNLDIKEYVNIVFADATSAYDLVSQKTYDLIFIDAAKGQYRKFFEMYSPLLNENGLIVCDNMDFHSLVGKSSEIASRNLRSLVRKLEDFNRFLGESTEYKTIFHHIGDGVSISKKTH